MLSVFICFGLEFHKETFYQIFDYTISALFSTILIDLIWVMAFSSDWLGRIKTDGGNEGIIRVLVVLLSIISLLLRVWV